MAELQLSTAKSADTDGMFFFQTLFESAPDAMVVTDERGLIVFANKRTKQFLGYDCQELIQKSVEILVPERYRASHPDLRASFYKDPSVRSMGSGRRLCALRKDGTEFEVEIYLNPVRMQDQVLVCCSIRDISERCKLEATLQQAQKLEAIGRLTGSIAHDFNNLLTVIIGRADIALTREPLSESMRRNVQLIHETGERAAALTRQLLQFSRQQVMKPQIVDLNDVLRQMKEMLRRLISEDIKLELRYDRALGHIKVDPVHVQQVIMNLVVNAKDAMPNGGILKIETTNGTLAQPYYRSNGELSSFDGPCVGLLISDTGCGIDEKIAERIFEPFFTTKDTGKGTGLGLATAFGLVNQADGHICFESKKGQGTTFRVYFPTVKDEVTANPAPQQNLPLQGGDETLLLVEDEAEIRLLLKDVLASLGYKILIAQDGEEAVRVSHEYAGTIHLMLVDVVMPKLNGIQVAKEIFLKRPKMEVIFTSGYTGNALIMHDILSSGVSFIEKPFKADEVALRIRAVLDVSNVSVEELRAL